MLIDFRGQIKKIIEASELREILMKLLRKFVHDFCSNKMKDKILWRIIKKFLKCDVKGNKIKKFLESTFQLSISQSRLEIFLPGNLSKLFLENQIKKFLYKNARQLQKLFNINIKVFFFCLCHWRENFWEQLRHAVIYEKEEN